MKSATVFLVSLVAVLTLAAAGASAADVGRGERVFKRCQACHTLEAGGNQEQGPSLHGIFGRAAGTAAGYEQYSEALKASGIVWTPETLDAFLAKPKQFIQGSTMNFSALRKEQDRADLIAYLQEATK